MPNDIFCTRSGHRTYFKWHRARRTASDPVFTGHRILEGMKLGASVEVDLVRHADGGFAVLHDTTLDRETTGTGTVATTHADTIRQLRLRDNAGQPTTHPVMLLEDLAALLAEGGLHPEAILQLDFKEDLSVLTPRDITAFRTIVGPVATHMILSAGDAGAVAALGNGTAGLHIGYDPCHEGKLEALFQNRDFSHFVDSALEASPRAEMIYLAHPLVLFAADSGFDIVDAFHQGGKRIDAYTIKTADAAARPLVERLLSLKADQITTDDPTGLAALLDG
ncbi:MAG TPA: glycerophosphodiester phosphodiesterase [Devosiaceae bacterium]|jgi:glycerophosphoryl diester phosphodiesterase